MAASKQIPYLARLLLTTVEPLFTLGGIALLLTSPETYVSQLTHNNPGPSQMLSFLAPAQAGSWAFYAFTEAVVFRAVDDLRVWRWLCMGMLLSDAFYCHHVALGLGGWAEWVRVGQWTSEDWLVTITTAPFLVIRIMIVAGLWGIGKRKGD